MNREIQNLLFTIRDDTSRFKYDYGFEDDNKILIKAKIGDWIMLLEEIERLNNIINKLEEVLNENVELTYVHYGRRQYNKTLTEGGLLFRDYIKSKLQELKGSDSNVKK